MGIRMTREFKNISKSIQSMQRVPLADEQSLVYMLRTHQKQADQSLSSKIKMVCSSTERSIESIEQLSKLLSIRLRAFSQFSTNTRIHFCKVMQYERFPANSLILKEGHLSSSCYIIVSGQVEQFIIRDGLRNRLNILNPGDTIGRFHIRSDVNTECSSTLIDTELLRIDKDVVEASALRDWDITASELRSIAHFCVCDQFLTNAKGMISILLYEPNETILFEGAEKSMLYWILSGMCRCTKMVPFIQRRQKTGNNSFKAVLIPFDPKSANSTADGRNGMEDGDEIVNNLLTIAELAAGNHFPDLPLMQRYRWANAEMFDRQEYAALLQNQLLEPTESKAVVSVVASSKVAIAAMARSDYLRTASPEMVLELLKNPTVPPVSIADLQQAFLEKRKWDNFKQGLIKDLKKQT
ncbi:hypothetical protein HK105_204461 [Polyrhizophydium stewartii]|uniref:Cyclic nucleotide-binding domain-containing protein n=1 Tax=Polyrhizophydium stewartii TaxID=2732419 RepID=A0ABR4N956_9FUNG|nr:hypothetical protein HK105_006557 [Polyrhizophydium stewartii]